jgi:hypothetical protein
MPLPLPDNKGDGWPASFEVSGSAQGPPLCVVAGVQQRLSWAGVCVRLHARCSWWTPMARDAPASLCVASMAHNGMHCRGRRTHSTRKPPLRHLDGAALLEQAPRKRPSMPCSHMECDRLLPFATCRLQASGNGSGLAPCRPHFQRQQRLWLRQLAAWSHQVRKERGNRPEAAMCGVSEVCVL